MARKNRRSRNVRANKTKSYNNRISKRNIRLFSDNLRPLVRRSYRDVKPLNRALTRDIIRSSYVNPRRRTARNVVATTNPVVNPRSKSVKYAVTKYRQDICKTRRNRREVLFSMNKTGSGSSNKSKIRTIKSLVRC
jgi:hypothetical protein